MHNGRACSARRCFAVNTVLPFELLSEAIDALRRQQERRLAAAYCDAFRAIQREHLAVDVLPFRVTDRQEHQRAEIGRRRKVGSTAALSAGTAQIRIRRDDDPRSPAAWDSGYTAAQTMGG